jgi:hypothetical protein
MSHKSIKKTVSISCLKKLANLEDAFLDNILSKYTLGTLLQHVYVPVETSVSRLPRIHLQDIDITTFIEPNKL